MNLVQVLRSNEIQQALRRLTPSSCSTIEVGKHHSGCPQIENDHKKESENTQHLSWYGVDLSRVGAVCLYQAVKYQDPTLLGSLVACGVRFHHHSNDVTIKSRIITLLVQALSSTHDPNRSQRALEVLEGCLQAGLNLNANESRRKDGDSLLHRVSSARSISNPEAVVALLIRHGAELDAPSYPSGMTPLMIACRAMNVNMVRALIFHGADVSATDDFGRNLLFYAMVDHHRAISIWDILGAHSVTALMSKDCILYGRTILHEAILKLSEELLEQMLQKYNGLDLRAVDRHGWTALHYASFTGNAAKIKLVLQTCGITDPNVSDIKGRTPLHLFGLIGRAPPGGADYGALVSQILIDDKTGVTSRGMQPSVWHANAGLEFLLTSGADPLAVDVHGNLPFTAFCVLDDLHHFNHVYKIISVAALCGGLSSSLLR